MSMTHIDTLIRERAYAIWEREGRPEGRERQHWEQAAREILAAGEPARTLQKAKLGKAASKGRSRKAA